MKILWTQSARNDRNAIIDFIALDDIDSALELDAKITGVISRLIDFPQQGRFGRVNGTRELILHANYILVYEIIDDNIFILSILHTSKQYPPLML